MPDGARSWTVVGPAGLPVEPVDRFLGYLQVLPRSPNTVAAYAYDLRGFVEFLDGHQVALDRGGGRSSGPLCSLVGAAGQQCGFAAGRRAGPGAGQCGSGRERGELVL